MERESCRDPHHNSKPHYKDRYHNELTEMQENDIVWLGGVSLEKYVWGYFEAHNMFTYAVQFRFACSGSKNPPATLLPHECPRV